ERQLPDDLVKPRLLFFRQRLRVAHLERDLVREPVRAQIYQEADSEEERRRARTADERTERDQQAGQRGEEDRGADPRLPVRLSYLIHVSKPLPVAFVPSEAAALPAT